MPADPSPVRFGRVAGAALLLSCVLLLGFAVALAVEDRSAVTTLLVVFALVSVPALLAAVLGLGDAVRLLRGGPPARAVAAFSAALALGHLGIVALSLRPGLDEELDGGDWAGAATGGVGLVAALLTLALVLPGRSLGVRLVTGLGSGVLALALLGARAVALTD